MSFIHCLADWNHKEEFWHRLVQLGNQFPGPWLILGDFNPVLFNLKKMGGRPAATSSRNGLFQLTFSHGFVDLGYVGASYTWCNGQHGSHRIKEQIDKGYATADWTSLFPHALVSHLPHTTSDHCLILLQTVESSFSGPKPLRFKQF